MPMSASEQNDRLIRAILGRLDRDMEIASQEDAAVVAAMTREAHDDADLVAGAVLTEREARALWTLEALGCGREES
jgi:hypothetical protein